MSQLHVYFLLQNQQAFKRLLDSAGSNARKQSFEPSSSGGKSWNRRSPLTANARVFVDVNERDWMGRTVLHRAASSQETSATEYVRLLLAHPDINVNLPDKENHWTALHRALYHGNIASAVLLLQRADIDTSLRDYEGYTAFDLYNSTLEGTKPDMDKSTVAELLTWGANRNAALGLGHGDDRQHPEQVVIRPVDGSTVSETETVDTRFSPIAVEQVAMSKLHTAVVTSESQGNLRMCGFGSGGRLGPGQHTRYSLVPLPQLTQKIASVALGQDHTLALTTSGEVLSWGLNRFSQLGYVVEPPTNTSGLGRSEEPIQTTARKVTGALKNKFVKGVAACKMASACWTEDEVFTWGTNNGQLGYDKAAHPVQVFPRVVTRISEPVITVTITDHALACLLATKDVICLWNGGHFKVNFPARAFPSEITVYRPPQATNNASIEKITSCDNTFAALSTNGEVFLFDVPVLSEGSTATSSSKPKAAIVPQRVWALRKKFSAVRDVALGADGSLIICTESGHVFVRARNAKAGQGVSAKTFKFQQVPYIQRAVRVSANATGAYGALRIDYRPEPIKVVGHLIAQDTAEIQPYLRCVTAEVPSHADVASPKDVGQAEESGIMDDDSDDESEDTAIQKDIQQLGLLCGLLERIKQSHRTGDANVPFGPVPMAYGSDLIVQVQSTSEFPAHRVVLAARSAVLKQVLSAGPPVKDRVSNLTLRMLPVGASSKHHRLVVNGCQPLSVLLLLSYLYSDDVPALWDRRVGLAVDRRLAHLNVKMAQVKTELLTLAHILDLPLLARALEAPVKRMPAASMVDDMRRLFDTSQTRTLASTVTQAKPMLNDPLAPDVVLRLGDKDVYSHSTILRARSPFFAGFFDDEDWTAKRWTADGVIVVDFKHLKWREMKFVMRFLCCGEDLEMFDVLDDVSSIDELLDFMFDVISAANELLVDRLILLCSTIILKRISVNNVCSVLSDASHFHVMPLVRAAHDYMAASMETLLESRMLDDNALTLIKELSVFVRQRQQEKYPVSRSSQLIDKAMETHREWLAMQDIPQPVAPTSRLGVFRDSPKMSPPGPNARNRRQSQLASPQSSPIIRPVASSQSIQNLPADDEVFVMDDPDTPLTPVPSQPSLQAAAMLSKPPGGWRAVTSSPKVNMRAIMAEAETSTKARRIVPIPVARAPSGGGTSQRGTPPKESSKETLPLSGLPRAPLNSPWRVPQTGTTPTRPSPMQPAAGLPNAKMSGVSSQLEATPSPILGSAPTTPRSQPQTTPKKTAGGPGMGPVITPTKQQAPSKKSPSSIRRVSSGTAWTLPPVQPVVQSSSSSSSMSFAAIQQLQLEQDTLPVKDKRSLLQIQEEERAQQVEEDFLKWWTAEEARLKAEEQGPPQPVGRPQKARKPRNSKNKSSAPPASASAKDSQDQIPEGKKTRKIRSSKDSAIHQSGQS